MSIKNPLRLAIFGCCAREEPMNTSSEQPVETERLVASTIEVEDFLLDCVQWSPKFFS